MYISAYCAADITYFTVVLSTEYAGTRRCINTYLINNGLRSFCKDVKYGKLISNGLRSFCKDMKYLKSFSSTFEHVNLFNLVLFSGLVCASKVHF